MRILVLTSKLPWPLTGGAEIRNFNLLKETAKRHEVVLLSFLFHPADRDHFPALATHCQKVVGIDLVRPAWMKGVNAVRSCASATPFILYEYHRPAMTAALCHLVTTEHIDVIHAHFLHMGQYFAATAGAAFVFDVHNLEHILWQRFAGIQGNPLRKTFVNLQCDKFVQSECRVASHSDKVVTLSDADRDEYLRIAPGTDIVTVPNGADVEFFQPRDTAVEPNSIIYFGNFGWPPQDDGALYFHHDIFPLIRARCPDARLYLVGKTPPEAIRRLASDRVIVTGYVEDIRDYIARAAVVVMPLRVGAGTKHRIFQSLAMQKALVTTTVAAEGIALGHDDNALIADDPPAFAAATVRVLTDANLRARLGSNGRHLVLAHHDWRAIYQKLDAVFHGAVHNQRVATRRPD